MEQRISRTPGRTDRVWRVCVSVLLIGLVLYNPFVLLTNPSNGLVCQAMARHRATVGASELQHFSPVRPVSAQNEVFVYDYLRVVALPKTTFPLPVQQEPVILQQPEQIAGIWFRPPPAL
jgi:hypothetical protein